MSETFVPILAGLGFLALFSALGSGPAVVLGRGLPARLALAPILGLALAGVLLTAASALMTMEAAAPWVLAPACLVSLAVAGTALRSQSQPARAGGGERRWALVAGLLALTALALATLPATLNETAGPYALHVYDPWTYIPADTWIAEQDAYADLPETAQADDLTEANGWILTSCGCRLGVISIGGAASELLGTEPDLLHLGFLAALFALGPLAAWFMARTLGLGPRAAALTAALALSPALLMLVADSVLGNLAGLALAPAVLAAGLVAVRGGRGIHLVLTALLFAGLISLYPEFVLPTLLVAGVGCAALVIRRRSEAGPVIARTAAAALGGAALAPVAVERAHHYLTTFFGATFDLEIPRYLTLEDFGAWLFGVMHLYELQRFETLAGLKAAVAIAIPLALAAALVYGVIRGGWRAALFVAVPIAVAALLAVYTYERYDDCQYCLWKSLTFALPFVGLGLVIGLRSLLSGGGPGAAAAALLAALAIGAVARADVDLTRAGVESVAMTGEAERGIRDSVREMTRSSDRPARLMLEGADATAAGPWNLEELYYLVRGARNPRDLDGGGPAVEVSFDPRSRSLLPVRGPISRYWDPGYRHVATVFGDLDNGRRTIARHGIYTLQRRAPYDVVVTATGYARDPREDSRAIPWIQGPFELWISSPRAGSAALRLRLSRPQRLGFKFGELGIEAFGASREHCVPLTLQRGRNLVAVSAPGYAPPGALPAPPETGIAIGTQIDPRIRDTESDPVRPPPMLLGLTGVWVRPGRCGGL